MKAALLAYLFTGVVFTAITSPYTYRVYKAWEDKLDKGSRTMGLVADAVFCSVAWPLVLLGLALTGYSLEKISKKRVEEILRGEKIRKL